MQRTARNALVASAPDAACSVHNDAMTARASALRLAAETIAGLDADSPTNLLPVDAKQWRRSVADAELPALFDEYVQRRRTAASCSVDANDAAIGRSLRPAALAFVSVACDVSDRLEILAALAPDTQAGPEAAVAWRRSVVSDAARVISALTAGESVPEPPAWPTMPDVPDGPRDVLLVAFGVPTADLEDASGSFSSARLLAAYRLRLPILQRACDRILALVADRPPVVFSGLPTARDVVTSPSPFVTIATAREIRRMLIDAFDSDPGRAAQVLADAWDQRDKEWSSHQRLVDRVRRAESAETEGERQVALLEAYKHMAEGLTRRWVWALLRLSGLEGERPSVGKLVEPAAARLGPIGARLERSLLAVVRNAEAHEDFEFDDHMGRLLVGDSPIEHSLLSSCLAELDILQRGWEAGLLAALQDRPSLLSSAVALSTKVSRSFSLEMARQRFGHAGQALRSFRRDGQRVDIELESLRAESCNPCFVALIQSAAILPNVSQFVVSVGEPPRPVIDLPVSVLKANWPVFVAAGERFPHALPQSTFLPCLTWARLACESVEDAAAVAAWMVLNDSQHAIVDAEANIEEAQLLPDRLRLAAAAGAATISLLPSGSHMGALERASRVAESTALAVTRGSRGVADELLLDRVLRLRDRLDLRPSVLPTLDRTPMTESRYPHLIS